MVITPEYLARNGTEDGTHSAIIQAVMLWIYPEYPLVELIYHVPNGGSRGSTRQEGQRNGARMLALGTKAGTPDICVPIPSLGFAALYVEVKKPDGKGMLEPEQVSRLCRLQRAGNMCAVVDNWTDGYMLIRDYLCMQTQEQFIFSWCSTVVLDEHGESVVLHDPAGYFDKYHKALAAKQLRAAKKRQLHG